MVTGAERDPKCGDPSFIKFVKDTTSLLFCAYTGITRQKTKLTVIIVTKTKSNANQLDHKLIANDSSLFDILYMEDGLGK